ncbi:hypothetical protein SAMN04489724_3353 [Algoriphagus locisalis]|uniref:DUF5675 domain-containing protein n=1 Tax=Algoriphagus locisalis TaxID=305507 RepID=A0A1I7CR99_9BACT|nr:hypothetical protein [Algoriphagus locisalis]SFU01987.1 hypothetical protein SAMN04489724_3353 [Algoriphagus locisalis]
MRLVLHRKYKATVTLGRLFLGQKQLCFTREPPKACFDTGKTCLEEGVYELEHGLGLCLHRPKSAIIEGLNRLGSCLHEPISCMEEGVYELEAIHSEAKGWEVGVEEKGKISSYPGDEKLESYSIYPVTSYRADGTPLFTKLAFLQLMERLELEWERGEVVELQIVSEGIPYLLESCLEQSYS